MDLLTFGKAVMELVRIIRAAWWDDNQGRFSDVAFKRSSEPYAGSPDGHGGISVFDAACAIGDDEPPKSICAHIAQWYGHRYPAPVLYWRFRLEDVEPAVDPAAVVAVPSDSGDGCHRNIHSLSRNGAKREFYRLAQPETLRICDDGDHPFTVDRVRSLNGLTEAAGG